MYFYFCKVKLTHSIEHWLQLNEFSEQNFVSFQIFFRCLIQNLIQIVSHCLHTNCCFFASQGELARITRILICMKHQIDLCFYSKITTLHAAMIRLQLSGLSKLDFFSLQISLWSLQLTPIKEFRNLDRNPSEATQVASMVGTKFKVLTRQRPVADPDFLFGGGQLN